jgi:hypothetical protein
VCKCSAYFTMASLMRRPKHFKRKNTTKTLSPIPEEEQALVPVLGRHTVDLKDWEASRPRRPRGTRDLYLPPQPLLTLPGKRVFTQVSPLKLTPRPRQDFREPSDLDAIGDTPDIDYLPLSQGLHVTSDPFSEVIRENTNGRKRKKQWDRWSQEVIPSLLNPYFRYLRLSRSLKTRPKVVQTFCHGTCNCRCLAVTLVTFEGTFDLILNIY